MEVWKIIFLSKWVICRFHVNLPGCSHVGKLGGCILRAETDFKKAVELLVVDTERPFDLSMEVGGKTHRPCFGETFFFDKNVAGEIPI